MNTSSLFGFLAARKDVRGERREPVGSDSRNGRNPGKDGQPVSSPVQESNSFMPGLVGLPAGGAPGHHFDLIAKTVKLRTANPGCASSILAQVSIHPLTQTLKENPCNI